MHGQSLTVKMKHSLLIVNGTKDPIRPRPSLADRILEASPSPSVRIPPVFGDLDARSSPVGSKNRELRGDTEAPSLFLVMRTLEGDLSSSRLRAEHLKGAQAGCCPRFDAELFEDLEDMFFYCRFAIPKNGCDLAIGLTLGKPQ
jgi:hypothetical protein